MRKSTFISSFAKSDNNPIDEYLNNEIEDVINYFQLNCVKGRPRR